MPGPHAGLREAVALPGESASFCSFCGRPPSGGDRPSRICGHCEMGLVLTAQARVAPEPGDAFLVTDERLLVRALSQAGEELVGESEPAVIHRPVSELVRGVTPDGRPDAPLLRLLVDAAAGATSLAVTRVRVGRGERAGERLARIGPCGPSSAALLVFEREGP